MGAVCPAISQYQLLPLKAVEIVARSLPWLELAIGILLVSGRWLRVAATGASLLLLGFFGLMVRAFADGEEINCGCFGPGEIISWKTLLRDGTLLAGSLALTAWRSAPPENGVSGPVLDARSWSTTRSFTPVSRRPISRRPAVRALRRHMVRRILALTGAGPRSRVLSLGCGIGDTELLLAPHVGEVSGIDLSPAAIRQARADAARARHPQRPLRAGHRPRQDRFDVVIAIFFLHHLPDAELAGLAGRGSELLAPGGVFYSLDPSRQPAIRRAWAGC